MNSQIDFGYPWYLSYGHLAVAAPAFGLWLFGRARKWPKWLLIPIAAVALCTAAGFLVARFGLDVNGRLSLPTQHFLASGSGRVLDMGAGTGRSTLMVLEARPGATVVALDLFGDSYERHFGRGMSGQERLAVNLKAAGVDSRAAIQPGDMRKLPFEPASFDAVVSTYAIDHLGRQGVADALREASRVLKPGGEFLMMVIAKDVWLGIAFGPMLLHGGTRSPDRWVSLLQDAGFQVVEQGARPGTLYFLARKP
jgi:ubiquinone/menaquinone biosynthesis C-methylase UbiE